MLKSNLFYILLAVTAVLLVFVFTWQGDVTSSGPSQKISAEIAKNLMAGLERYILLDVRTPEEYEEAHIEGATLIPLKELAQRAPLELADKNLPVFIYCRSGRRSAQAAKILSGQGYAKIYDFGGITSWPYGTVSGQD